MCRAQMPRLHLSAKPTVRLWLLMRQQQDRNETAFIGKVRVSSTYEKVVQFVALALAVLLTVQPALATMTCTQRLCGVDPQSADCCPPSSSDETMWNMSGNPAMDSTGAFWQTPPQPALAESSCTPQPCCIVSARTTAQAAIPAKSRVNATAASVPVRGLLSVTVPVGTALTSRGAVAPAPARYVLFQVLRI